VAALVAALSAGGAQGAVPADSLVTNWTYSAASPPAAWDLTSGSPAVLVAVVDSGWERCRATASARVTTVSRAKAYRVRGADCGHRLRLVVEAADGTSAISAASRPTLRVR
jgi:predicted kinase